MKFKKIFLLVCLTVCLFSIASVCAGDANDTARAIDDSLEIDQATDDVLAADEDMDLSSIDTNVNVLNANPESFTQLNATINGNDSGDIYLYDDYECSDSDASLFENGIAIGRDVTIHGNGHTIDGNKSVRIFQINGEHNIVFINITFKNGETANWGYGSCIEGKSTAINCTFKDSHAQYGGCVAHGTVINCTFSGNTADHGGALYDCNATNCNFSGNVANYGGAMYDCIAINCNFSNNKLKYNSRGGAIYGGKAINCTFTDNSAERGGAISNCEAIDCNFTNNVALDYGGAAYDGKVTNCIFSGNSANKGGGATYDTMIIILCIFETSSDTVSPNKFYPNFNVSNVIFTYDSGDKLLFDLTYDGQFYNGYNATINITQNGSPIGVYHGLSGADGGWIVSLIPGTYDAKLSLEPYKVDPIDVKLTVNKKNSTLKVDDVLAFDYNQTGYLEVSFTGARGVVAEIINHHGGIVNVSDNMIAVSDLDAGNYSLRITTVADDYHNNVTKVVNITVNKVNSTISVPEIALNYGESLNVTVTCVGAVNITSKINGKDAQVNGFVIPISGLNAGKYTLTVTAVPDANHIESSAEVTFNVLKINTAIASKATGDFVVDGDVNVTFTLPLDIDGIVDVAVDGKTLVGFTVDKGVVTISGRYAFGNHTVVLKLTNDTNYNDATANVTFEISKVDSEITIQDIVCKVKENFNITVTIASADATGNVTLKIDGVKVKTATINNGTVDIAVPGLDAGKHTVEAIYSGDEKYSNATANVAFEISKVDSKITIQDIVCKVKENFNITVTIAAADATGNVILKIDGVEVKTAAVNNGTVDIAVPGLDAGKHTVEAIYSGDDKYSNATATKNLTVEKIPSILSAKDIKTTYNVNKNLEITLTDSEGNPLKGVEVTVNIKSSKAYTTDKNGQIKISTKGLVPKTYTVEITFAGDTMYLKSTKTVKVTVNKAKPIITAKKKTFKKSIKVKKYTITLKNNKAKAIAKAKVTLKVKGKTYKAKTNNKGKATFKITKLTKKGTHKAVIKYAGDKYYQKATKNGKITIK